MLTSSIPAPPWNEIHLGPLAIRLYALAILIGVVVAATWSDRRWLRRGGTAGDITAITIAGVPGGIIGARLYHVATDPELFYGHWGRIFDVWKGGLGIPGAMIGGVLAGAVVARHRRLPIPALLDVVAPTFPLAQAIGRFGNYFNQELFGRPSTLPWALHVDPQFRPPGFSLAATFHPTFAYEALWNLVVVAVVLTAERRRRVRTGYLFAVFVGSYFFGRFWIEGLRIDHANRIAGLRVNEWVSLVVVAVAAGVLVRGRRRFLVDFDAHPAELGPIVDPQPQAYAVPAPTATDRPEEPS